MRCDRGASLDGPTYGKAKAFPGAIWRLSECLGEWMTKVVRGSWDGS